MRAIYPAMFRCMLGLVGKTIRSGSQLHVVLYGPPPSLHNSRVRPVRVAGNLCISFILSAVSAICYADTVPPTYSTSAPPIVKYSGAYTNFDTPAAACTDQIAHSWDYTSQTGGVYDHTEPYTDNLLKCFATFYVNSNPVTSWWSIVGIMRSCDGRGWNNYPITCVRNICPANSTGTPEVNPTICTCNDGYVADPTRTSCISRQYTISIEANGAYLPTDGTYTIEPSTALLLIAVVKDQIGLPKADMPVTLSVRVADGTGGHVHSENRPKGNLSCNPGPIYPACPAINTDTSGSVPFAFYATSISGAHTITATCDGCGNTAIASVHVMVKDLIPIPASPLYALTDSAGAVIGAIPGKHIANHYLKEIAIGKLNDFATNYQATYPGAKLYLNDASLVWGGLFDVGGIPWQSPHNGHARGVSIDIRAENSGPNNEGAVPTTAFADVAASAARVSVRAALHCTDNGVLRIGAPCNGIPNNRHFHVDF